MKDERQPIINYKDLARDLADRVSKAQNQWILQSLRIVLDEQRFAKLLYAAQRFGPDFQIERYIDPAKLRVEVEEPTTRGTLVIDPNQKETNSYDFTQIHSLYYDPMLLSKLEVRFRHGTIHLREVWRAGVGAMNPDSENN